MEEHLGIPRRYYNLCNRCWPALIKMWEIQHFYYCKDTRVPVEKGGRVFFKCISHLALALFITSL